MVEGTGVLDVYPSQFSGNVEVNDSLFFCKCCKYLDRVSVLFFRDVIEYEDSQCLFPFSFFFSCNDTITSAVAEIGHIPNALNQ